MQPIDPVHKIRYELGLSRAIGFSVWGQGCASITTAIRVAWDMILSGSAETIMVVGADCLIGSRKRQIERVTVQGDGGSAVIVRRNWTTNRLVEISSQDEGCFFQPEHLGKEQRERYDWVYFLATTRIAQKTLRQARLTLDDISLIVPHNINAASWTRILGFLKCSEEKFFGENIRRHGHAFGSDIIVNLADAITRGRLRPGEYALLLTAGLGASWGCLIIQH